MYQSLENLTAELLDKAKQSGATTADAFVVKNTSLSMEVRNQKLEKIEKSENINVSLRVFIDKKSASVGSSFAKSIDIQELADRAVAMASEAPSDKFSGLADASQLARIRDARDLELFDNTVENIDPIFLKKAALQMEEAALDIDEIRQCEGSGAGTNCSEIQLATSNGFSGGYKKSSVQLFCSAIAGEGSKMERDFSSESRVFLDDLPSPTFVGSTAGSRATKRLNPKRPPTGSYPILFDERVSTSLVLHLLSAINGASISRGSSWLFNDLGNKILPKKISLWEEPFRKRGSGSSPFDGEGLQKKSTVFIENGTLNNWILDLNSARKLGLSSTANASVSLGSAPRPSLGNLRFSEGEKSPNKLMAEMNTGLLCTSLIGSTINLNNGDYSRGASGFWIENGEIAYPVNECTIAGNLKDIFKNISPSNDSQNHLSKIVPSLLVDGLTIAGADKN